MEEEMKSVVLETFRKMPKDAKESLMSLLEGVVSKSINANLRALLDGSHDPKDLEDTVDRLKELFMARTLMEDDVADAVIQRIIARPGAPAAGAAPAPAATPTLSKSGEAILEEGVEILKRLRSTTRMSGIESLPMAMVFVRSKSDFGLETQQVSSEYGIVTTLLDGVLTSLQGVAELPPGAVDALAKADRYMKSAEKNIKISRFNC